MSEDKRWSEKPALQNFLDDQRHALIEQIKGLSEAEARSTPTASSLSLLSIVKHAAIWEKRWFQVIVAGRSFPGEWPEAESDEPDATFRLDEHDTITSVVAEYRAQVFSSNEILDNFDLDAPCAWQEMKDHNLRWVAVHLIEETARHAGHADIIRETIDGQRLS